MKVCLINPPNRSLNNYENRTTSIDVGLPLGIMQLGSLLEREGYNVKILDCIIDKNAGFHEINKDFVRFGISEKQIISELQKINPDIVGISCRFTSQIDEALYVARLVKSINKNLPVLVGGASFVAEGKEFLENNKDIDTIVLGEGEKSILKLLECIKKKKSLSSVNGISYRDKTGKIKESRKIDFYQNLDELPFPAYHLVDMETFFEMIKKRSYRTVGVGRSVSIVTSRGCPFSCIFCSAHLSMGKKWRPHSAEYTERHIKYLKETYNVNHIFFEDDNISLDPKRFDELLNRITKLHITWDVPNGVRADTLNRDLIRKMKISGCKRLIIAPESGDQKVLNNIIKKAQDLRKVEQVAKWCKEEGLVLTAFYVIGFPGETKADINRTINFALKLKRKYNVGVATIMVATPLKGSELYDLCKKNNYLVKEVTPRNMLENTMVAGGFIETKDFTIKDLMNFKKKFTRLAYLYSIPHYLKNPKKIVNKLTNIDNFKVILRRFIKPNL